MTDYAYGEHWSIWPYRNRKLVTIFTKGGFVIDDNNWCVMVTVFANQQVESMMPAQHFSNELLKLLATSERRGSSASISYFNIDPYSALMLALEGVITLESLRYAGETDNKLTCKIVLNDTPFTVVVWGDSDDDTLEIRDANDRVLA